MMITPFIRPWSTMTKMESMLHVSGRLVMRSMESCLKGSVEDEEIGFKGGQTG